MDTTSSLRQIIAITTGRNPPVDSTTDELATEACAASMLLAVAFSRQQRAVQQTSVQHAELVNTLGQRLQLIHPNVQTNPTEVANQAALACALYSALGPDGRAVIWEWCLTDATAQERLVSLIETDVRIQNGGLLARILRLLATLPVETLQEPVNP